MGPCSVPNRMLLDYHIPEQELVPRLISSLIRLIWINEKQRSRQLDLSPYCFLKIEYVVEGEKVFSVLLLILANPKTHMLASKAWKIFLIMPQFKNTLFIHQVCVYMCILILQHTCGKNFHKDSFIKIKERKMPMLKLNSRVALSIVSEESALCFNKILPPKVSPQTLLIIEPSPAKRNRNLIQLS